jgi:murein DD-endopeptidase MepM/ murein hydrolase activator NlpD
LRRRGYRGRKRRRITGKGVGYTVVAALAVVALRYTPRIEAPKPAARLIAEAPGTAADTAPEAPAPAAWTEQTDTLGRGETLAALLERSGVPAAYVPGALRAASSLDHRRIPAGMPVTVGGMSGERIPTQIVLQLGAERVLRLRRTGEEWAGTEERVPWTTDTIAVSGTISSTLYDALDEGAPTLPRAARSEIAWSLADILEYRVDMSRDLQAGDAFSALVERSTAPSGATRIGRVLAASFTLSGKEIQAIRYTSRGAGGEFFDQDGKSLRAQFLRAPLAFRRVSSVFGLRRHPILGVWRAHKGTDYAAASGTPVRTIGDGVVVFAGRKSGYGNVVDVRHRNGFISRYGHLSRFARGVRAGTRVTIGQTIAAVGMTGLATAPHLHFEVLVRGVQRDPKVALQLRGGEPIPAAERGEFARVRSSLLASLDRLSGTVRVASGIVAEGAPAPSVE